MFQWLVQMHGCKMISMHPGASRWLGLLVVAVRGAVKSVLAHQLKQDMLLVLVSASAASTSEVEEPAFYRQWQWLNHILPEESSSTTRSQVYLSWKLPLQCEDVTLGKAVHEFRTQDTV